MASLNMCQFVGNLGKAPEIKTMNSGDKVANFSLACNESWKNKDGEKQERTEWVNIVVWGNGIVDVIDKYVNKGSRIYVQGQLQTRKYEKDGIDRYTTEIVVRGIGGKILLLDGKSDSAPKQETGGGGGSAMSDLDDEIPFITSFSIL